MATPTATAVPTESNPRADKAVDDSIMAILGTDDDPGAGQEPAPAGSEPAAQEPQPAEDSTPKAPEPIPEGAIPDGITGVASKADDAPPAAPTGDDDDDDAGMPDDAKTEGKAKNAWSKIKAEKKELKEKVAALEAQLNEVQSAKPPEMQEILDMQKKLEEKENLIGQLDVTRTASFKAKFDIPMERTLKRGEAMLLKSGMSEAEAQNIMAKMSVASNAQEISDLVADQPLALQGALMNIVSEYEQLSEDRKVAVDNWRETQLALDHNEQRSEEIKLAQNIEKDTAEAVQAAAAEGNFLFTSTNGANADWDAGVEERTKLVKGILHTAKAAELVKWVVEGVSAKPVRDAYLAERNKVLELTKKLESITARAPHSGAGAPPAAAPAKPTEARSPDQVIGGIFG